MPEINDYDPIADGNSLSPPNGFPEDMDYSDVNNSSREVMAVLARNYRDENGSLSATGINDLTISANGVYPALYQGLRLGFRAANNNTGAMTLTLNSLPAAPLVNTAGAPMEANSIIQNLVHYVVYNGSAFQLVTNGFTFPGGGPGLFSAASPNITPEGPDRVALLDNSNGSAPSFASITAIRTAIELFNASNPTASPALGDFLHFRDISDVNLPKTATIQDVLDTDPTIYRNDDPTGAPVLNDSVPFSVDSSGFNATATFSTIQTLLTAGLTTGLLNSVNLNVFTTSGTYTKPSELVAALIICIGGGGGGGASRTTAAGQRSGAPGGGGGGAAISLLLDASISASQAYTVGAGGTGGSGSGGGGGGGGDSVFGTITGSGGSGGPVHSTTSPSSTTPNFIFGQTAGGGASGGQINLTGQPSIHSFVSDSRIITGGGGGGALFGSGRPGRVITSGALGGTSGTPLGGGGVGGGGFASQSSVNGGAGGSGAVIILEFLGET